MHTPKSDEVPLPSTPVRRADAATPDAAVAPLPDDAALPIDVFISYRRGDGRGLAEQLREKLLAYRLPDALVDRDARRRPLVVFRDEPFSRPTADYWTLTVLPALARSRLLVVLVTPSVLERLSSGEENWVVREVKAFRSLSAAHRDRLLLVTCGVPDDAPTGLEADLPRAQRTHFDPSPFWRRLRGPGKGLQLDEIVQMLVADAYGISYAEMTVLRREAERAERRRRQRTGVLLGGIIAALTTMLLFGLSQLIRANREAFDRSHTFRVQGEMSANALSGQARESGQRADRMAALQWLSAAQTSAWTPQFIAELIATPRPRVRFERDVTDAAWPIAFRPGSHVLATGGRDGSVRLVDLDTGRTTTVRDGDGKTPIVDLAFDGAEALLVVATTPADSAWNAPAASSSRSRVERLDLGDGTVRDLHCGEGTEHWLAVASHDGHAYLGSRTGIHHWAGLDDPCEQLAGGFTAARITLAADGKTLLARDTEGGVFLSGLGTGRSATRWPATRAIDSPLPYVAFSGFFPGDDGVAWIGTLAGTLVRAEPPAPASPLGSTPAGAAIGPIAFAPAAHRVAVGDTQGLVTLSSWPDRTAEERLHVGGPGRQAQLMALALSEDGEWLATQEAEPVARGSDGSWLYGTVRAWHRPPLAPTDADPVPLAVGFDRDGRLRLDREAGAEPTRAASSESGSCTAVPFEQIVARREVRRGKYSDAESITPGFEGEWRLLETCDVIGPIGRSRSGTTTGFVRATPDRDTHSLVQPRWFLRQDGREQVLAIPVAAVAAIGPVRFAGDGRTAFVELLVRTDPGARDDTPELWRWRPGEEIRRIGRFEGDAQLVDYAVDPMRPLIVVQRDRGVVTAISFDGDRRWESDPGVCCTPGVVAISDDGRRVVAIVDGELRQWLPAFDWTPSVRRLDVTFRPVAAGFHPDSRTLFVADASGAIAVFDTGSELREIRRFDSGLRTIRSLALSPDGFRMAVSGPSGYRLFGGVLPENTTRASRLTRLSLDGGGLDIATAALMDQAIRADSDRAGLPENDAVAAEFWRLLNGGGITGVSRLSSWELLFSGDAYTLSADLRAWTQAHRFHPLAFNLAQWVDPARAPAVPSDTCAASSGCVRREEAGPSLH